MICAKKGLHPQHVTFVGGVVVIKILTIKMEYVKIVERERRLEDIGYIVKSSYDNYKKYVQEIEYLI